jgi:hypothetical protein
MKVIGGITFCKPHKHMGVVDDHHNLLELRMFDEKRLKERMIELKPRERLFLVDLSGIEYNEVMELCRHDSRFGFEFIVKKKHPIFVRQRLLYRFLGTVRRLFEFCLQNLI